MNWINVKEELPPFGERVVFRGISKDWRINSFQVEIFTDSLTSETEVLEYGQTTFLLEENMDFIIGDFSIPEGLIDEYVTHWAKIEEIEDNVFIEEKLRISHFPNVPCKAFQVDVEDEKEAFFIINVLANQHLFLLDNNIIPDYANSIIVEMYLDGEWQDYYNGMVEMDWDEFVVEHL